MEVGKIIIDFHVTDNNDPRVLNVIDASYWRHIENKPSIIEITLPGDNEPIVHYFTKKQVNLFNSSNLNLNCPDGCEDVQLIDLPDGIYIITLKGSPDTFFKTRKFLKTSKFQLELDQIYINMGLECEKENIEAIDKVNKINLLLAATEAHVRHDNICKANETFTIATDMLEDLKNCKECVDANQN